MFVPVSLNYDRVLEDRVLIAAGERGDRRFGARISVVLGFVLRKLWQRMRGKDTRFGVAAVSFGSPLSLRAFGQEADVSDLSDALMARIAGVMPVTVVPMIAQVLAQGAHTLQALCAAVETLQARLPKENLTVPMADLPGAIEEACVHMRAHGVLMVSGDTWAIVPGQENVAAFYANSIRHFLSDAGAA